MLRQEETTALKDQIESEPGLQYGNGGNYRSLVFRILRRLFRV